MQVKKAMEVTQRLGGEGYTFWGGREGYSTLLNTDLKREFDHLGKFLHMAEHLRGRSVSLTSSTSSRSRRSRPRPIRPRIRLPASTSSANTICSTTSLNIETNHATLTATRKARAGGRHGVSTRLA
ncbi:MAG: hypothetical protein R3F11_16130 [Verrucomicrobiales bacterium]